jgi:hypothetical protein
MGISNPISIGTNTGTGVNTVAITVGAGGVPAGSFIFVGCADSSAATTLMACTDTAGNTYPKTAQPLNGVAANGYVVGYYAWNAKALVNGDTITVTLGQTGKNAAISAFYCTGVRGSSDPAEYFVIPNAGSSTTPTDGPSSVPAADGDLFVYFVATDGPSSDTFTQDSTNAAWTNFPVRTGLAGAAGPTIAGGAFIQTTAAALTAAPILGTSRDWGIRMVAFKAAPYVPSGHPVMAILAAL